MKKLFFILALVSSCVVLRGADYNIVDFGAKTTKGFLNTDCIQKAIDKCTADGGGRVILPRGSWLSGTVWLKNNVTLYLEKGAVLQGSDKMADYSKHLIRADHAENIGVEGAGTVDGCGSAFWFEKPDGGYDHDRPVPGYMLYFEGCTNVKVAGVRLQNAESWTLHLLGCIGATVRDVVIRNPLHGPNNDGIDIQACKDVTISGCDIYTSDDAIVLKNRHPKYVHIPCANISVTNCIITSVCNALKIGTETRGAFRNINFSNCTVRQAQPTDPLARVRVNQMKMPIRSISGISIESVDGSDVNGVTISNITMEDVRCPIFIRLANRGAGDRKTAEPIPGTIRNVVISNVTVRNAWFASSITAIPGSYVENVILSNIIVTMKGSQDAALAEKVVDEKVDAYPDAHMWKDLPASSFYVRHVKNIDFTNIKCNLDAADVRPLFIFDDVKDLCVRGLVSDNNVSGFAALRLVDVAGASFSDINVKGTPQYIFHLRAEGNTDIRLRDVEPSGVCSDKACSIQPQTSFTIQ